MIYDPAGNNQTIGNQIVVLLQSKGGTVINFFNEILNFSNRDHHQPFAFNLAFKYSTDRGATWLPKNNPVRAQTIATLAQFRAFGTVLPDDPDVGVRGGDILFDVAVNRSNGNLYAVWQDARFSDFEMTRSRSRSRPTAGRPGRRRSRSISRRRTTSPSWTSRHSRPRSASRATARWW